jgi:phosphatidylinositol N-acetylglucosaminyltransferase subunit C
MALNIDFEAPFPALTRSSTAPISLRADHTRLAPEDAFSAHSPPRRGFDAGGVPDRSRRMRLGAETSRSRSRRRKRTWKKLLWVKQSCTQGIQCRPRQTANTFRTDPDNYTDQATFLENLQRNPRLQPYDFWPLVADSTVIVQHVCSVIIFVVCFVAIFQERVSPLSILSWGSFATFLGWLLWERWVSDEEDSVDDLGGSAATIIGRSGSSRRTGSVRRRPLRREDSAPAAGITVSASGSTTNLSSAGPDRLTLHSHSASASSLLSQTSTTPRASHEAYRPSSPLSVTTESGRTHQRLGTIKSAILIYSTLLGLSPILKSLTRSTSSDSIWAMSFWLLAINIFFFDYSGGVGVKFPASLSTNAALMASTVLASRLPSTGQVFSLTLFSIEVFGLFPVFRRYARHRSWQYHVGLTVLLVLGAGGGVGMILGDAKGDGWPWKSGLVGMAVGVLIIAVAMGGCSWWLIGLQKYKNEIYGPWDPARPIIISRRHWDDG